MMVSADVTVVVMPDPAVMGTPVTAITHLKGL
jgi:hypothetical protein